MPPDRSSQQASSKASADANRAQSSRGVHSASNPSSSSNPRASPSGTLSQSRRPQDEDAAARKARRQKRREEEAYQVRGWENLYGGGGSKPVFAHDPLPTSRNRSRSALSASQPVASTSRNPSSSTRRTQSASKPSDSISSSSQQLTSSTAPVHASTSRLSKRKATSPASSSGSPKKRPKEPAPAPSRPQEAANNSDSSDDGFEITGVSGPAAARFPNNDAPATASKVKASPSPHPTLKSTQPTQSAPLRRSVSRAPSAGRPSPSTPRVSADRDPAPLTSATASRDSSRERASRASTTSSSTGPAKLTPDDSKALTETAYNASKQGTALADFVSDLVQNYYDMLSPHHPHRPTVEQFQKKLSEVEPDLTIQYLREVTPTLPRRFAKSFSPAITAWVRYKTPHRNEEQNNAGTSASVSTASGSNAVAAPGQLANPSDAQQQVSPVIAAARSPSQPSAQADDTHATSSATTATEATTSASATSAQALPQTAEEPSATLADAPTKPMDTETTNEIDAANVSDPYGKDAVDVGHDSTVDSASSPQAFGTPPEQPDEEEDEQETHQSDHGPDLGETPMVENLTEPGVRETENSVQLDEQGQEEQPAQEELAPTPREGKREEEMEKDGDEQDPQERASAHETGRHNDFREEDELVDELEDEDHTEIVAGGEASKSKSIAEGEASAREQVQHEEHASAPAGEQVADTVSANVPEQVSAGDQAAEEKQVAEASPAEQLNSDAPESQPADAVGRPTQAEVESPKTKDARATHSPLRAEDAAVAERSQVEDTDFVSPHEGDAQHVSNEHGNAQQEADAIMVGSSAVDDEQVVGSSKATASGEQPVPANDLHEVAVHDVEPATDAGSDQVAVAVEAVEQAIAAESEAQPSETMDTSVIAPAAEPPADASVPDLAQATSAPVQEDTALDPSSAKSPDAAASDGPTVTTPPVPLPANDAGAEATQQVTGTDSVNAATNLGSAQDGMVSPIEAEPVQQSRAPSASASAAERRSSPVSAAVSAVSVLNDASAAADQDSGQADQSSAPSEVSAEAGTAQLVNGADIAAERGDQLSELVDRTSAQDQVDRGSTPSGLSRERESSQAASESTSTTRPKKTIDDRMRSMLKDLAGVTGRKSSYSTIQKLKPQRIGDAPPNYVSDRVEHWQDPSRMIPWQCLQELGPEIFHKRAREHSHLSMHEMMERVASTRSVQHLMEKLPERVMTRALMEFPRLPHMMHNWDNERHQYYRQRGIPEPTDVEPGFRYADQDGVANGGAAVVSTSVAPSSSTANVTQLQVPRVNVLPPRTGDAPPVSAPSMTQSQSQPQSLASFPPVTQSQLPPLPPTMPQATFMNAALPPHVGHQQQGVLNPVTTVSPQTLTQAGSQLLAAHIAQHQQQLQQQHQQLRQQQLQQQHQFNAGIRPEQGAQLVAALNAGQRQQPPVQQPVNQAQMVAALHPAPLQQGAAQPLGFQQHHAPHPVAPTNPAAAAMLHQQQQQQQLSDNARRAAMVKEATDRVFSGLAADCLSFAEQVVGSSASNEVNMRAHYSEADVLHILGFVVNTYQSEVESERGSVLKTMKAEERLRKIESVREAGMEVLSLTQTLCRIKMCLNEAASVALRATGEARTDGWLELLNTSERWRGVRRILLTGGREGLSRAEAHMLLQRSVERVNKRLEEVLERLMSVDDVIGGRAEGGSEEDQAAEEAIRKECEQIGRICCKHVVGVLVG